MKKTLFALFVLPAFVFAQSDPKATAILDEMGKVNNAYASITAGFEYTLDNKAAGVKDTRSGNVLLSKGNFALDLGDYKVSGDGKIVWVTMTDLEEVQIYDYQEFKEDNDFDPSEIFSGYSAGFKTQYHESSSVENVKVDVVDLFPEDPSKRNFSRIRLFIEQSTKHLKQAKVFGKDGNHYTYNVTSFKSNADVSNLLKPFDQKALEANGFSVEDLR
jgi:outer membrane lipoprotein-sorting protein